MVAQWVVVVSFSETVIEHNLEFLTCDTPHYKYCNHV